MHAMISLAYGGVTPRFASAPVCSGAGVAVLGRVTAGHGAWFGTFALVRADGHDVRIGDDFHMGAHATVHIAHDLYPADIGTGVTAGEGSVIHACTVHDGCHIGAGAIILDGAVVHAGAVLARQALVFPRTVLAGGWLYAGAPAKPVRQLDEGELAGLHAASRAQAGLVAEAVERAGHAAPPVGADGGLFVAANARLTGQIDTSAGASVWFGCVLEGGHMGITIGRNTNIQDNCVLRAVSDGLRIGCETTVGHNVTMTDCTVGDRSLIGIGAVVAQGTRIGDDVLLAAGAQTTPGQTLEAGWLYGGSPARQMRPLDRSKRDMIAAIWPTYCSYARNYATAQRDAGIG